jgi:hypothetical protein
VALLSAGCAGASISPANDIRLAWSGGDDPQHVELLREAGVTAVLLPWPGGAGASALAQACRAAGIATIAELASASRWEELRGLAERARAAGFTGVALEGRGFSDEKALRAVVQGLAGLEVLVFLKPEQLDWRAAPALAVLRGGLWPGMPRTPGAKGPEVFEAASASREPWLDANSYLVAHLRGLFPGRAALLGYRPDEDAGVTADRMLPYGSLELALAESFVAGGNVVLALPQAHQAALLAGKTEAVAAWRALGQTASFLKEHAAWFRSPDASSVAVAAGTLEQSGEILNMLYRRNACPVVFSAAAIPSLAPGRYRAVVVANVPAPSQEGRGRLLDYARGGGLLVTAPAAAGDPPWWPAPEARKGRADEDRDWYSLGQGTLIAYREPVLDPHEFALDVIDSVGVRTRDLRLWNASTVIGLLKRLPEGRLALALVNYGSPRSDGFPARVEGLFRKATLHEPGAAPRPLKVATRTSGTEVTVDRLGRLAVIVLE